MNINTVYQEKYSAYPGEYIPLWETETLLQKLKKHQVDTGPVPAINMKECPDCFRMEVAVPGIKREDIIVFVHNYTLSIVVLHKGLKDSGSENLTIHEFDTEYSERHIHLPPDADTEFTIAEYREGILNLYVPRTNSITKAKDQQIVVY